MKPGYMELDKDPYFDIITLNWMDWEDIDFLITEIENWVVDEKPNITLSEAIMLSWNIGIAS
jgi:hypothetical protein|tara:strand:- start:424 stop:609 length:186 start_codon:yes stop_codon:yes gene_type:complete